MIPPLKAIAGTTRMSNPIATNSQKAYNDACRKPCGEKLNINCNETRSLLRHGTKLDILA